MLPRVVRRSPTPEATTRAPVTGCIVTVMTQSAGDARSFMVGPVWRPALPVLAICVGALLPWGREPRSGILDEGKYALALALAGLLVYALAAARQLDV